MLLKLTQASEQKHSNSKPCKG